MNTSGTEYFPSTGSGQRLGDALGSVCQLADLSGAITYSRAYDPGVYPERSRRGVVTSTTGTSSTTYGYTGEAYGDSTQLTYLRSRFYSGGTGRFLTRDTWGGDDNSPITFNFWQYTYANPVNLTDPSGHDPWWCDEIYTDPTQIRQCIDDWFNNHRIGTTPSTPAPTLTPVPVYIAANAIYWAVGNWKDFSLECADFVSQALLQGGLSPDSEWFDRSPVWQQAGNASGGADLYTYLTSFYQSASYPLSSCDNCSDQYGLPYDSDGFELRGNVEFENWLAIQPVSLGDVIFYKTATHQPDGSFIVHSYWDHAALIIDINQPETHLISSISTGKLKPKIVEANGLLNIECQNQNYRPPECQSGMGGGRSVDDTNSLMGNIAIVFMQRPK